MKKLRVAVVGCGAIGTRRHIPEYAQNPNVELVGFCDIVPERAAAMVDKYKTGKAFTLYQDMFDELKPDAVSVCVPNVLHARVAIAAAAAGAHILVEKPMACSEEEAQAMIAAAQKNGVQMMLEHNHRYMPPHIKAREILRSGTLGKPISFRTTFGHGGPESWSIDGKDSWFFRKEEAFVGAMGDLGIHKADLIRWLLDDEVVEVGSMIGTLDKKDADVDDNAVCILRMKSGMLGTLTASWTCYKGEDSSTIIWCENGVIKIGTNPNEQVIVEYRNGNVERYSVGAIATNEKQTKSGVIDAFVDALVTGKPVAVPGIEGLRSLRVILAALESEKTKSFVKIAP